ncbi:required for meiotic nuclear division protein 1 homolog isoform X2 [Onthophagus taurus]|uniref:required for meiotic nuclear division protein 1 homolog isoform X2 n=1 Tax=Onthophagus taurus TaxID=166361 RepID=UPI0039BEB190
MKLNNIFGEKHTILPRFRGMMRRTWQNWYLEKFKDHKNEFNDNNIFMEVKTHVFKSAGYKKYPEAHTTDLYKIAAYGSPAKYNLEKIVPSLTKLNITDSAYQIKGEVDLVHTLKENSPESRETFIFRDGVVVFWNFTKEDTKDVMDILSEHQIFGYVVDHHMQSFDVNYYTLSKRPDGVFTLPENNNFHEKYVTSCMLATSVSLTIWQTVLELYLHNILENVAHDMNIGYTVKATRREVEQLHGNLSSLTFFMEINDHVYQRIAKGEQAKMDHFHKELWIQNSIHRRIKDLQKRLFHCNEISNLILVLTSHRKHRRSFRIYYMGSIATILFAMLSTLYKIRALREQRKQKA